jgi:poly-gamma-glutamate synthesis protein (capsule biosynthesis protein)
MGGHRPRHLRREPEGDLAGDGRDDSERGRRWLAVAIVALVTAAGIGGAVALDREDGDEASAAATSTPSPVATVASTATTAPTTTAPPRHATLVFGGDVLIHSPVWQTARVGDGHDFSPMLDPITAQLQAADVAICHLEVTLARAGEPLSSYPRFRVPAALATDLAEAGFDGCSVSSNHALDFGEQGVAATLDAMDAAGLRHAGTARSAQEAAAVTLYDAGGIRVAQLSFAYGFNGFRPPAGREWLVNEIDPARIAAAAQAARTAGAEVVVASLHWGNEYTHGVVAAQQAVADALSAQPGLVDLVVGHHAHVVQPISKVGEMWVVWGMGNLLSNNSPPGCCRADATDGMLVTVEIGDAGARGSGVGVRGLRFTPTWNERDTFRVLPVAATLTEPGLPADLAADLRASFTRTTEHVLALGAADLGVTPDRTP